MLDHLIIIAFQINILIVYTPLNSKTIFYLQLSTTYMLIINLFYVSIPRPAES